ncbi:MAG: phospholipid/cholesterol/gamma-HCH transport system substrate-binding protein [Mycobacterium sp.]|nr:phospholipid/cholesterol/gamma-HCH transport system substrate-binding protein [Mycobacterium sp.]
MIVPTKPLEWSARLIVDSVRALARRRTVVAMGGLVLTLLVALTYIVVGSLGINPARSTIAVRVLLPESGGLLPNQDVTLRGVLIGRVKSVTFTDTGVEALAAIDADVRVPNDSVVRVSALSPAGEQYLDFRPANDRGPALTDGSVIGENQTTVPVSLAQLLAGADGALAQLDPRRLGAITDELRVGHQGPQKLAALLDGGAFLISTLDSVLPQTVSVLRNSRTVFTTLADLTPGLRHTSQNLQQILRGINAMDGGFRTLADRGDAPLTALDNIVADNSDTMVQLLGDLTTIGQLMYLRIPALQELFTTSHGSTFDALTSIFHDGGLWAIVDPYPRYSCDYNLPRPPAPVPNYPEPYRYTYCTNPDPSVLVRGARNAPRPPGDDTAGPPPGYDPLARTDPTPVGPNTIPTPYGGPQKPLTLPPN